MAACIVLLSATALPVRSLAPFGANVRVSDDASLAIERRPAAVADSSGNVYVAWAQSYNGDTDIYFARSTDGGRTWSAPMKLGGIAPSASTQDRPSLALGANGEIAVAWQDDRLTYFDFDVYASLSLDGGATFSAPVRASDGPSGSLQLAPRIAVGSAGRVAVAWQDYRSGNGDIRLSTSSLSKFAFGPSVRVDDDPGSGTAAAPSVVISSADTIYVGYHDNRTGSADVYLAKSIDGGASFGASIRIDDTGTSATAQGLVSIAVDGLGHVYAAWEDARAGEVESDGRPIFDVYFALSTDSGRTFSKNIRVDDGPRKTSQEAPRIAVGAAGTVYVVWDDSRNTDWDPYFSYSTNAGATFAPNIRMDDAGDSTTDPPLQYDPQVVESRTGLVFGVWEDDRGLTADIYGATAYFPVGSALLVHADLGSDVTWPGDTASITVRVTSNGTAVDGASIALSSSVSGAFGTVQALGAGTYLSSFTSSASLPDGTDAVLTTTAQKPGFVAGATQALLHLRKPIVAAMEPMWDLLAVGQTMPVRTGATAHGGPLSGASVLSGAGVGGTVSPGNGTTDSVGSWTSWFTPADTSGGTNVTISATVTKSGYDPGSAKATVAILAVPRPLDAAVTSRTREMMSRERATVRIDLTSAGVGVTRALVSPFCLRGGNFSAVAESGAGVYQFAWEAPDVTSPTWVSLSVRIQRGGYVDASAKLPILLDPNMTRPTDPTQMFVVALAGTPSVQSGQSVGVTLYAYTMQGYVVSGATVAVTVPPGMGTITFLMDNLNGMYTFVYTAPSVKTSTGVFIKIEVGKFGYATGTTRIGLLILP